MTAALIAAKPLALSAEGQASVDRALERAQIIQHLMKAVMQEGTHYGASFPGDKKKNLLKPGADTLAVTFQLVPEFVVVTNDLVDGHREHLVTCTVKTSQGTLVAMGVGSCSTMESKYRYRNAARKCPLCGKEAIIKGKKDFGGGWLCWKKKDGCGAEWPDGAAEIEQQENGKVQNPDPADQFNTVLKIAKKRAFVDGMITATGCSDMFTQDLEDIDAQVRSNSSAPAPAPKAAPAAAAAESSKAAAVETAPAGKDPKLAAELLSAMGNAIDAAEISTVWNTVMGSQEQIPSADMVKLRDLWQKRRAELGGAK